MKNYNYNLVKLLHICLDNVWRIEKHYAGDAKSRKCQCSKILAQIKKDSGNHIKMLLSEINKHNLSE